jgi:hypothetical protein
MCKVCQHNLEASKTAPSTYVQICLEQADDVEVQIAEQVPHGTLAIKPRVVDAKVHGPNPSVQDPCARMRWRRSGREWHRSSERAYESGDGDKSEHAANMTTGWLRNGRQRHGWG